MVHLPPIVVPAAARHTATVIFAHGLGDSGAGWVPAVENWRRRQRLDHVKFVLPHAPAIPITCNMGMRMPGWYDIRLTDQAVLDGTVESLRAAEDAPGIEASREYFRKLIQAEVDAGIPSTRVVLGGFSQGGAMALFTGLTSALRLAGIVALSTYLPLSADFATKYVPSPCANQQTPVLMAHGTADPVVPFPVAEMSRDHLRQLGFQVDWKQYAGMGHSACPEEMDDVEAVLETMLGEKGHSEL